MNKRSLFALCLTVSLTFAAATASAQALQHTLQKGETLYSVSKRYKVPYEALAAINDITDPTKVKVGTVLLIPSVHVVAKGETLYGIARQAGVSVGDLLAANKLNQGYLLKVGDVLVVPATAGESTTVASSTTTTIPVKQPQPTTTTLPKTGAPQTSPSTLSPQAATSTTAQHLSGGTAPGATTSVSSQPQTPQKPGSSAVPMPEPVKTQDKAVDPDLRWPASGKAMYLEGKLEGVMIRVKPGELAKAVAAGTVVSAGPSRGFSQVVFVQAKSGYVYVYGGIESLSVKTGDQLPSGTEIGKIGIDPKDGSPIAYFFVFRNGQPIDPAVAPRD